jgi:hypothetical protein
MHQIKKLACSENGCDKVKNRAVQAGVAGQKLKEKGGYMRAPAL